MNKKAALLLITIIIINLLLVVFLVYPLFQGIRQEANNLISQKAALVELENKQKNIKEFQNAYKSYQSDLEKIDRLFIDAQEPVGFIRFLEAEALKAQITVEISPVGVKETKSDLWPSVSFRLQVDGQFSAFMEFLEKIETSSFLLSVSNLDVRKLAQDTEGNISASFLIKVYVKDNE
ncbi:MAG: type 4a pilus biogenesis protein PilO [Candidatus Nealsonbacteria bacterium]